MATVLIVVPPRQGVSKHIMVLLLQRGDDGHHALSKTTSSLALDILAYFC
jgi:hypothetical protein